MDNEYLIKYPFIRQIEKILKKHPMLHHEWYDFDLKVIRQSRENQISIERVLIKSSLEKFKKIELILR